MRLPGFDLSWLERGAVDRRTSCTSCWGVAPCRCALRCRSARARKCACPRDDAVILYCSRAGESRTSAFAYPEGPADLGRLRREPKRPAVLARSQLLGGLDCREEGGEDSAGGWGGGRRAQRERKHNGARVFAGEGGALSPFGLQGARRAALATPRAMGSLASLVLALLGEVAAEDGVASPAWATATCLLLGGVAIAAALGRGAVRGAGARARVGVPDVVEPEHLLCPITHAMMRDPVFVVGTWGALGGPALRNSFAV